MGTFRRRSPRPIRRRPRPIPQPRGIVLRYSSDTNFLVLQSYHDGSDNVVEVNNSGTLTGAPASIAGAENSLLLRWSKSGDTYQAKYCRPDTTDCSTNANWTSIGPRSANPALPWTALD